MRYVVHSSSDRGMAPASTINFLSNEDTPELAPGFFIDPNEALRATSLPLVPFLPEIVSTLSDRRLAVLRAEPGSGKSTLVPIALMTTPAFSSGRVIMLEPRRIAALSVATRMAELLEEDVGERVGYSVRLERRVSPRTQVEVLTEGMLTRRMQVDPGLDGVSVLIFDEFHERSIHADLALALALDIRKLRPDLAILIMSATMDSDRVSDFLSLVDEAPVPVIDCPGRPFPVNISYRPISERGRLGEVVGFAVLRALEEESGGSGDILVFLPGIREIGDAASILRKSIDQSHFEIHALHGSLPLSEQRRVVSPLKRGARRRVVLSTNVAETSLTVPGITMVVDAGYLRLNRFHLPTGMDRLSLEKVSLSSADQRAGRAGRLGPGRCLRLWSQGDPRSTETEREILRVDLSSLVLDCALWGARNIEDLHWLDPPPQATWDAATEFLRASGALSEDRGPTERGARMASLGVSPRLAALVMAGEDHSQVDLACAAAAALSDRDCPSLRGDSDFRRRLAVLRFDSEEVNGSIDPDGLVAWRERTLRVAADLRARLTNRLVSKNDSVSRRSTLRWTLEEEIDVGSLLAAAFPDRVARRQPSGVFRFSSGREAHLDGPLDRSDWIVAVEIDAGERLAMARIVSPLSQPDAVVALEPMTRMDNSVEWNGLVPRGILRMNAGRLTLSERKTKVDPAALPAAFASLLAEKGLSILPWEDGGGCPLRFLQRARFYARAIGPQNGVDWSDAVLLRSASEWLGPFLRRDGAAVLDADSLLEALRCRFGWDMIPNFDREVPERFRTPAGTSRLLDYSGEEPALNVKIQELFGLPETPRIAGAPVLLRLLSPAERPLQVTRDLRGFWLGSYAEVRKEMRGRYPKHYWPENPLEAEATARAKPRRSGA